MVDTMLKIKLAESIKRKEGLILSCLASSTYSLTIPQNQSPSFDCSIAHQPPAIIGETCREYVVGRQSAPTEPEKIKVTACSIDTLEPEEKIYFLYTDSPGHPAWLCRNKKEHKGLQQPEQPTLTLTITDKQVNDPGDNMPTVSGSGYGDDFFDDKRRRKPGMPATPPIFLEVVSAGWLPAGLFPFVFNLELPDLSGNPPVLFQQGILSDDSDILIVISGSQQRIYRRIYQFGTWYPVGQVNVETLFPPEDKPEDFIAEDKLIRSLVGGFGWEWQSSNTKKVNDQSDIQGIISCPKGGDDAGGNGARQSEQQEKGDTHSQSQPPPHSGENSHKGNEGGASGGDEDGDGAKPPPRPNILTKFLTLISFNLLSLEQQAGFLLDAIETENHDNFVYYTRHLWHSRNLEQVWLHLVSYKPDIFIANKDFLRKVLFLEESYCFDPIHHCTINLFPLLNNLMVYFLKKKNTRQAIALYDFWIGSQGKDCDVLAVTTRAPFHYPVAGFGRILPHPNPRGFGTKIYHPVPNCNFKSPIRTFEGDSKCPVWVALEMGDFAFIVHVFSKNPGLLNSYFLKDKECYTLLTAAIFLEQDDVIKQLINQELYSASGTRVQAYADLYWVLSPLAFALVNGKYQLAEIFLSKGQCIERQAFIRLAKSLIFEQKRFDLFEKYVLGIIDQPEERETFKRLLKQAVHYEDHFSVNDLKALYSFSEEEKPGSFSVFLTELVRFNNKDLFLILQEIAVNKFNFHFEAIKVAVKESSEILSFIVSITGLNSNQQHEVFSLAAGLKNTSALVTFLARGYNFDRERLKSESLAPEIWKLLFNSEYIPNTVIINRFHSK